MLSSSSSVSVAVAALKVCVFFIPSNRGGYVCVCRGYISLAEKEENVAKVKMAIKILSILSILNYYNNFLLFLSPNIFCVQLKLNFSWMKREE